MLALNEEKFAICLEDKKTNLLSPCLCSVTIGSIHKNCFNQWLNISDKKRYEICFYFYRINSFQHFYIIYLRNILVFVKCLLFPFLILFIFFTIGLVLIDVIFVITVFPLNYSTSFILSFVNLKEFDEMFVQYLKLTNGLMVKISDLLIEI
jgi:hypothetical protein